MSIVELERSSKARRKLRVIDCDIHPAMTSWTEVHTYLEKQWIDHLSVYGSHLRHAFSEALSHPRMSPDAARIDAYPEEGGPPGSSLSLMRSQHLDPNGIEVGMLIPLRWNPGSQRNLDFGAALTRAMNFPTFGVSGMTLLKRFTLIIDRGVVERVFYPVFPPDRNATDVIDWLSHQRQP